MASFYFNDMTPSPILIAAPQKLAAAAAAALAQ